MINDLRLTIVNLFLHKNMNKLIAIVGMCGAGKSICADFFTEQGFQYLRFGQITLDEIKKRGLQPNENLEKEIREGFRREHGMAAYAILNLPKIEKMHEQGDTILDGLYSWSEYKILKEKFPQMKVIAVFASPQTRYQRISQRFSQNDPQMRNRNFSIQEARARDFAEIQNIEKGGPIAMADYTVINEGTLEETKKQLEKILEKINSQ